MANVTVARFAGPPLVVTVTVALQVPFLKPFSLIVVTPLTLVLTTEQYFFDAVDTFRDTVDIFATPRFA